MTDNEIIKAMECHSDRDIKTCAQCPLFNVKGCAYELATNAFDLINRQKAEIERLNKQLVFEIESAYDRGTKAAVKEFAERFNTALSEFDLSSVGLPDYDRGYEDCMTAVKDTFDNLVK